MTTTTIATEELQRLRRIEAGARAAYAALNQNVTFDADVDFARRRLLEALDPDAALEAEAEDVSLDQEGLRMGLG